MAIAGDEGGVAAVGQGDQVVVIWMASPNELMH